MMVITTGLSHNKTFIYNGYKGYVGRILQKYLPFIIPFESMQEVYNADVFLHLASKTNNFVEEDEDLNYLKEIITYCKKNNIKKFVYFSSISVYGTPNKLNIDENYISNSLRGYAHAKKSCEEYLKSVEGINILVLRFPAILTQKSDTFIVRLLQQLQKNEVIKLQNHNQYFNAFVGVKDITDFLKCYSFKEKFEILNFASKSEQTLLDIVDYMKEVTLSSSKIVLEDSSSNFFNLSIEKLLKKYRFIPSSYQESIKDWIELRDEK